MQATAELSMVSDPRYGIHDMGGSAKKIYEAALGAPDGYLVIVLAHNGPTGLGSKVNDICGRDWVVEGGDHGDPDLAQALSYLRTVGVSVPLVVFGHMHNELAHKNGARKMIMVGNDNTVYLNGAIVPRVKHLKERVTCSVNPGREEGHRESPIIKNGTLRAFTLVEIQDKRIVKISETWVSVLGDDYGIAEENILYEQTDLKTAI